MMSVTTNWTHYILLISAIISHLTNHVWNCITAILFCTFCVQDPSSPAVIVGYICLMTMSQCED